MSNLDYNIIDGIRIEMESVENLFRLDVKFLATAVSKNDRNFLDGINGMVFPHEVAMEEYFAKTRYYLGPWADGTACVNRKARENLIGRVDMNYV